MLRAELKANALKGDQKEFHLGKGNTEKQQQGGNKMAQLQMATDSRWLNIT